MTEDEFFAEELERLSARWHRDNDYLAVVELFLLLAWNGRPLPEWLTDEAKAAFLFTFNNGGAPGKGNTGGHRKRHQRDLKHRKRHQVAAWQLAMRSFGEGGTRADAFERASKHLAGTFAQGSAKAIEKSYDKITASLQKPN